MTTKTTEKTVSMGTLDERHAGLRMMQPAQLSWMRESVAKHGLLNPVVVNDEDEKLVVLDGFKRLTVLREREERAVWVRVVGLPDSAARAAILTINAGNRGGLSELEEGWIIRSLVRDCKLPQKTVAELLGHHKAWVCRRLLLVERLCESVQKDLRLGLVSPTVAREVARLPRGNQDRVTQVIRENGLTSRQASELCSRYLEAQGDETSAAAIEELLSDPLRFVEQTKNKPVPEAKDPRLSEIGEQIRRRLVRFDRACDEVRSTFDQYPVPRLRQQDHRVLGPLGADIRERGQKVIERLTELARCDGGRAGAEDSAEAEQAHES